MYVLRLRMGTDGEKKEKKWPGWIVLGAWFSGSKKNFVDKDDMCGESIYSDQERKNERDGWKCDRFVLKSLRDEVINAHDKKRLILFFPIWIIFPLTDTCLPCFVVDGSTVPDM